MYISLGDYQTAKKWVESIFKCKIPEAGTSQLIDLGRICFEFGEKDQSLKLFLKAYEKGQYRAFKEYDAKYLKFFELHKK